MLGSSVSLCRWPSSQRLSQTRLPFPHGLESGLSAQMHWSVVSPLCSQTRVSARTAFSQLPLARTEPITHPLHKCADGSWPLLFHVKIKTAYQDFDAIVLHLHFNLERISIIKVLSVPIHEHDVSPIVLVFSSLTFNQDMFFKSIFQLFIST